MNRNLFNYYKSLLQTEISGAQKRTFGTNGSDSEDEEETRHKLNVSVKSEINMYMEEEEIETVSLTDDKK